MFQTSGLTFTQRRSWSQALRFRVQEPGVRWISLWDVVLSASGTFLVGHLPGVYLTVQ